MEEPVQFTCNGNRLYGILHIPERQAAFQNVVIMVTGGPQTRYWSQRLYVHLARFLCDRGISVFRFDYEGMGDSEGAFVAAEGAGPSIHAAVQYIDARFPQGNRKLIWSICNGATASALYAARHNDMVAGLIFCNPLIHDEIALYRKQYYKNRLLSAEFWVRLFELKTVLREVIPEVIEFFNAAFSRAVREKFSKKNDNMGSFTYKSFLHNLVHFRVPVHCILSENDDVAMEFLARMHSGEARKVFRRKPNIKISTVNDADHTFSNPDAREKLFCLTVDILRETGFDVVPNRVLKNCA
jgi:uncharacterized protein